MPSSHLILCRPFLLLPPIPPSIRVFSSELTLLMWWPKYWSFSLSISPSNEHPGLVSFRIDWLDFLAVQNMVKNCLTTWEQKKKKRVFVVVVVFFFLLLYNTELVLPYIDMNLPRVYMSSQTWTSPRTNLSPYIISLGHPSAPAPSILYPTLNLDWRFVSYMILYMFQCHSPKSSHPFPLAQSPKDSSIQLCLFCCLT